MSKAKKEPTLEEARTYVRVAIAGFASDPASTNFQRGYLAALVVLGNEALGMDMKALSEASMAKGTETLQ